MNALMLLSALAAASVSAGVRDIPNLPHPATIPTRDQGIQVPLELPLPVPELDRRPQADPEAAEKPPSRVFEIDMGGADDAEPAEAATVSMTQASKARPAAADFQRAVASGDPQRVADLFDGDRRAAVKALAEAAGSLPLEPSRVESLLRLAEPLSVERIRDAQGRTPPAGQPQQLFNTSVHDALAARPLPQPVADHVVASLERLASRAINDPAALAAKLLARFHELRSRRR